jgi:serine/threonine protein kinase
MPVLTAGRELNKFKLIRCLGEGAFAEVWLAENEMPVRDEPREVALKVFVRPQEGLDRVVQEARNTPEHDHIVKVYSADRTSEGLYFIVMEYMVGGTLAGRLQQEGRLPEEKTVRIALQVLQALHYAHEKGFLHRDVKPLNILFDAEGKAKLGDFGLAVGMSSRSHLPDTVGTPAYMAPESWEGQGDAQSDLWSLGVTLYQMVTGQSPFSGDSLPQLMRRILEKSPQLPHRLNSQISGRLEEVILKALEKDKERRFQSASEMHRALMNTPPEVEEEALSGSEPTLPLGAVPLGPVPWDEGQRPPEVEPAIRRRRVSLPRVGGVSMAVLMVAVGLFMAVGHWVSPGNGSSGKVSSEATALVSQARTALESGDYEQAGRLLEQGQQTCPEDPDFRKLQSEVTNPLKVEVEHGFLRRRQRKRAETETVLTQENPYWLVVMSDE